MAKYTDLEIVVHGVSCVPNVSLTCTCIYYTVAHAGENRQKPRELPTFQVCGPCTHPVFQSGTNLACKRAWTHNVLYHAKFTVVCKYLGPYGAKTANY